MSYAQQSDPSGAVAPIVGAGKSRDKSVPGRNVAPISTTLCPWAHSMCPVPVGKFFTIVGKWAHSPESDDFGYKCNFDGYNAVTSKVTTVTRFVTPMRAMAVSETAMLKLLKFSILEKWPSLHNPLHNHPDSLILHSTSHRIASARHMARMAT